jgi:putative Holliday junction resolvase
MRILGIDYGDRRIGLAISDPMGWTAQGLATIDIEKEKNLPEEVIYEYIKSYKVEEIVIGLPKNMDGSIGERVLKTREFIKKLQTVTDIPIKEWDERMTSKFAKNIMKSTGKKTGKNKGMVDKIAAMNILQGYLDSK